MTKLKVMRRAIVKKPINEVILELQKEGWPLIADNGDRAFFYQDRNTAARITKRAVN